MFVGSRKISSPARSSCRVICYDPVSEIEKYSWTHQKYFGYLGRRRAAPAASYTRAVVWPHPQLCTLLRLRRNMSNVLRVLFQSAINTIPSPLFSTHSKYQRHKCFQNTNIFKIYMLEADPVTNQREIKDSKYLAYSRFTKSGFNWKVIDLCLSLFIVQFYLNFSKSNLVFKPSAVDKLQARGLFWATNGDNQWQRETKVILCFSIASLRCRCGDSAGNWTRWILSVNIWPSSTLASRQTFK